MTTLRFDDLKQYSDTLRSRSGEAVNVSALRSCQARSLPATRLSAMLTTWNGRLPRSSCIWRLSSSSKPVNGLGRRRLPREAPR